MAARESRELVSAVRSFAHPDAPGLTGPLVERKQKVEQHLETRLTIEAQTTAGAFVS